ncbi:MAG: hypothetical protein ACI4MH_05290 [Candidatus Coproplasma sp.]
MFTLSLDRPEYIRVRAGVTAAELRAEYLCPVPDGVSDGSIVRITRAPCEFYVAKPWEDYKKIAEILRVDEGELRLLNLNAPVFPSKKIFYVKKPQ